MKVSGQTKEAFLALSLLFFLATQAFAQDSTTNAKTTVSSASASTFFSREKWGISYLNYMNGPTFSESAGGSVNHYLTLKHKFNPNWALSAVMRSDSNFGNGNEFMTMGDSYLRLEYPTIYKAENGLKISGDVRYYAPLSDRSRASKIVGVISPYMKASLDMNRANFTYVLIPKLYLNTLSDEGQRQASHGHYAAASYKLSPKVNLDFALYPVWTYSRDREVAFNDLPAYPGFTVNFSETFSVSPYMEIPLLKAEGKTMSLGGVLSYVLL